MSGGVPLHGVGVGVGVGMAVRGGLGLAGALAAAAPTSHPHGPPHGPPPGLVPIISVTPHSPGGKHYPVLGKYQEHTCSASATN